MDYRIVFFTVAAIFFFVATLTVGVSIIDAYHHMPLAEFVVKKFSDILMLCVGALTGLLAGRLLSRSEDKDRRAQ